MEKYFFVAQRPPEGWRQVRDKELIMPGDRVWSPVTGGWVNAVLGSIGLVGEEVVCAIRRTRAEPSASDP